MNLKYKDMNRLKVKGWGKIHSADNSQKTAGVAIFILDKVDFIAKILLQIKRDIS